MYTHITLISPLKWGVFPFLIINDFDLEKVRLAFVIIGGMNRKDWLKISKNDMKMDFSDLKNKLVPVLSLSPSKKEIGTLMKNIEESCRKILNEVLPLRKSEREFLYHLNEKGEIMPEFLTDDAELSNRILSQPQLKWKSQNVQNYKTGEE